MPFCPTADRPSHVMGGKMEREANPQGSISRYREML